MACVGVTGWILAILAFTGWVLTILNVTAGWAEARPAPTLTPAWYDVPLRSSAPSPPGRVTPSPAAPAPPPPQVSDAQAPAPSTLACPAPAPAPEPASAPPPPEGVWKNIEFAATICGAFVAMVLSIAPLCYHLYNRGSIRRTLKLFSTIPMLVGLANAISWALYALAVLKRDSCFDLVMTNLLSAMANLNFLVFMWVSQRKTVKGYITIILSLLAFLAMFILQQVDPQKTKPYEFSFGILGCATLFLGHCLQIKDILFNSSSKSESISVICNVLPNMLLSVISILIVRLRHPKQKFVAVSSWINAVLCALEFVMIIKKSGNFNKILSVLNTKGDEDAIAGTVELGIQGDPVNRQNRYLRRATFHQGDQRLPPANRMIHPQERHHALSFPASTSAPRLSTILLPQRPASTSAPQEPTILEPEILSRSTSDHPKENKKGLRKWLSLGCN